MKDEEVVAEEYANYPEAGDEDVAQFLAEDAAPYRDLKKRLKDYALRVIRLYAALPKSTLGEVLGKQVLRSGTSVGAHYREGLRARSAAELISKLEVALQELEESIYWMELIVESNQMPADRVTPLMEESDQLCAMLTTAVLRVKSRQPRKQTKP